MQNKETIETPITQRAIDKPSLVNTKTVAAIAGGMLTRRTLATRWAKSTMSLKRMEKSGQLPFLKLGRDVRYRREDIERIEAQAEVTR